MNNKTIETLNKIIQHLPCEVVDKIDEIYSRNSDFIDVDWLGDNCSFNLIIIRDRFGYFIEEEDLGFKYDIKQVKDVSFEEGIDELTQDLKNFCNR